MFIKLFLRYLKPYKWRLILGFFCMVIVAFLGTYQILVAKPVLDVLFDQVEYAEREAATDRDILDRQRKLQEHTEKPKEEQTLAGKLQAWARRIGNPIRNEAEMRLYGSSLYRAGELNNITLLREKIAARDSALAEFIYERLSPQSRSLLSQNSALTEEQETAFLEDINAILAIDNMIPQLKEAMGQDFHFSDKTKEWFNQRTNTSSVPQANRSALEDIWPEAFKADPPASLYYLASENKTKTLRLIVAFLLCVVIIKGIFEYLYQYHYTFSLASAMTEMKGDIFKHLLNQDLKYLNNKPVGFLMSRVNSDVANLLQITKMLIKNAVLEIMRMIALFSLLLLLHAKMTAVVFLLIIPIIGILAYFARMLKKVGRKGKKRGDILSSVMNESFGNVRLIKALSSEDRECRRFDMHNHKVLYYMMKMRVAKFASSPIIEFFGVLGVSAILLWGGWAVWRAEIMSASTFILYVAALVMFYSPVRKISRMNVNWQMGKVSAERIEQILSIQPKITDPPEDQAAKPLEDVKQGIAVKNISFSYEDKPVLKSLSVDFPAGTTTAIVGRSGSGKTTLGNLLLRLYDPDEGHIELDGIDLRKFKLRDLRDHFGIVTQDTVLFNDSIAVNIAYGREEGEIDQERLVNAAKAANAHDFIMALDGGKGYDSPVGPGGSALSGGQRQRIAIARAFYRDPDILLFDEATSSLDTESEGQVQQAIESLMHQRTVIIIAHRLTTIMHADNIIVLDDGELVEQGTHQQLIAKGGKYATLYRLGEFADE